MSHEGALGNPFWFAYGSLSLPEIITHHKKYTKQNLLHIECVGEYLYITIWAHEASTFFCNQDWEIPIQSVEKPQIVHKGPRHKHIFFTGEISANKLETHSFICSSKQWVHIIIKIAWHPLQQNLSSDVLIRNWPGSQYIYPKPRA